MYIEIKIWLIAQPSHILVLTSTPSLKSSPGELHSQNLCCTHHLESDRTWIEPCEEGPTKNITWYTLWNSPWQFWQNDPGFLHGFSGSGRSKAPSPARSLPRDQPEEMRMKSADIHLKTCQYTERLFEIWDVNKSPTQSKVWGYASVGEVQMQTITHLRRLAISSNHSWLVLPGLIRQDCVGVHLTVLI